MADQREPLEVHQAERKMYGPCMEGDHHHCSGAIRGLSVCVCYCHKAEAIKDDDTLDAAELAVYEALRLCDCSLAVDPTDPDDCAGVAVVAVRALRDAGFLP